MSGGVNTIPSPTPPPRVRDRVRREAVEQRAGRGGEMARDVPAEAEIRAPGGQRDGRGRDDVERHDRAEREGHRREEHAGQGDRRVPEQVDAVRRIDVVREEGVHAVRDGVGMPAQEPHEQRRVAGIADPRGTRGGPRPREQKHGQAGVSEQEPERGPSPETRGSPRHERHPTGANPGPRAARACIARSSLGPVPTRRAM